MIRIRELYRLQNLRRLRLIAGQEGLERTITAAVLFEYDPSRMQLADFYRGDLVVTTLAYARADAQLVSHSLTALMNQGIAGLLVKTAYFDELPQDVVALADRLGTPIFLFDETYIEEVILEVTDLIRGRRCFAGFEKEIDALLQGGLNREQVREKMERIDPTGAAAYKACALLSPQGTIELAEKLFACLSADKETAGRCICMEWKQMIIILHRMPDAQAMPDVDALLEQAGVDTAQLIIGESGVCTDSAQMDMTLCEAVYAARAARIEKKLRMTADELGLYGWLFPMSANPFVVERCRRALAAIRAYDAQNRTNLEHTARVYVEAHMEIAAAAKALYQHPNTVRYRLSKIQQLMHMEDNALFAPMLSLMAGLSAILESEGRSV